MSNDCSGLNERVGKLNDARNPMSPNHHYAKRVEKLVAEMFHIQIPSLSMKNRTQDVAYARFVLFAILWQPNGYRSTTWLARRYGCFDHTTVLHGIKRVQEITGLLEKQISIMAQLEIQLEFELFGSRRPEYVSAPDA